MAPVTYREYYLQASAAYHYVKTTLTVGVGNRILGQPGFILDRGACVSAMRAVTTPKQKAMDEQLAERLKRDAERIWGKNPNGTYRANQGTLDLFVRSGQMKLAGEFIELNAKAATLYKCGNCEEFSSLTFKYLKDHGVQPLDWFEQKGMFGTGFGNHAFVIVGRNRGTTESNVNTWNKEVVWCDPYEDKLGGFDLIKRRFGDEDIKVLHRWDPRA
jgi:hypothetical protein